MLLKHLSDSCFLNSIVFNRGRVTVGFNPPLIYAESQPAANTQIP